MKRFCFCCSFFALLATLVLTSSQPAAAQKTVSFVGQPVMSSGAMLSTSIALGDVNGDGIPDLVISNACAEGANCSNPGPGVLSVLLGNGDGTFQAAVLYNSGADIALSVAIADVNGDHIPDIVVTNQCATNSTCSASLGVASVLLGNGDGTFQTAVPYSTGAVVPNSIAIADLNGDGIPDLAIAHTATTTNNSNGAVTVLLGKGNGIFQTAVVYGSGGIGANSVAIGDVNGDGIPDLVVANSAQSSTSGSPGGVSVLIGNGNGTFQTAVPYSSGGSEAVSVAIQDLNGDGIPDLSVANNCLTIMAGACTGDGSVSILLGNGNGTFQSAVSYDSGGFEASSVAVGDVNGDGVPDLAVSNTCQGVNSNGVCQGTGEVSVLAGNGDGSFKPAVIFQAFQSPIEYGSGGAQADRVLIGDVNGDGKPDLEALNFCLTCANGTARILLNNYTASSTTAVSSSLNPAPVNTPITFSATVTSTVLVPNGTLVTFYNGLVKIGTGTTTNGVATLGTSFSKAGNYTIRATTSANGYMKGSTGTTTQVITN